LTLKLVGQATEHLRSFREVIGIDPSQGMLQKARAHVGNAGIGPSFTFLQGSSEDLSKVLPENESVDLLVSGTAYLVNDHLT
jgi:ubiquinone/menaquinone biosynthesis C-methylase UbiE